MKKYDLINFYVAVVAIGLTFFCFIGLANTQDQLGQLVLAFLLSSVSPYLVTLGLWFRHMLLEPNFSHHERFVTLTEMTLIYGMCMFFANLILTIVYRIVLGSVDEVVYISLFFIAVGLLFATLANIKLTKVE